ncbi:hypothetical protein CYME_CMS521C [Cyanidioschyzon merolae strain 10D]|jgi:hypothetical protein|uniref:Mediator of RNA polymerase II transcription subunit 10 n=1 Tax=Cyanidioschyzon merolae (strain NIES-3377 / 10D) TaxID=280699 RepID=M1VHM1_CYAM1|nr:hypothetical protein CYME_CMS521C [Cyanidioschyzon merolae strain 10D]BAM82877.1 hypothetical protein CYME_CMS521C [Cyanidioschyzon merolae strain 10D]|eukprot:XP_005538913.1 hypothetical protein CYME_CMS521C [Cyanidioschyzon merolae strain 10D]
MSDNDYAAVEKQLVECIRLWERLNRAAVFYREASSQAGPDALSATIQALAGAYQRLRALCMEQRTKCATLSATEASLAEPGNWRVPLELLQWLDRGENPDLFLLRLLYDVYDLEYIGREKENALKKFRAVLETSGLPPEAPAASGHTSDQ